MISEAQFELLNSFSVNFDYQHADPSLSTSSGKKSLDLDFILQSIWTILHDQPKLIEHALEVLDNDGRSGHFSSNQGHGYNSLGVAGGGNKSIRKIVDPVGRFFFLVNGSQHQEYLCLDYFCSCQNFAQMSLLQQLDEKRIICKHLLAVRIGSALQMIDVCLCSSENFLSAFLAASSTA